MSNFSRSVLIKLLVINLFAFLFIGIGYFIRDFSNSSKTTKLTSQDNLKTSDSITAYPSPTMALNDEWIHYQYNGTDSAYDSRKLGFGIDYPGYWKEPLVERTDINTRVTFDEGFEITYGDFYDQNARKILNYGEVVGTYSLYHSVQDISINGFSGKKLTSQTTSDPGGIIYIFPGNYVIRYYLPEGDRHDFYQVYPIQKEKFEKIMSSLYFADKEGDVNPIDPNTKWHIFKTDNYSLQYPQHWIYKNQSSCPTFSSSKPKQYYFITVCETDLNKNQLSIEERLNKNLFSSYPQVSIQEISRESTTVGGVNAIKQVVISQINNQDIQSINYYFETSSANNDGKEKIFEIKLDNIWADQIKDANRDIEEILSTFKLKNYN